MSSRLLISTIGVVIAVLSVYIFRKGLNYSYCTVGGQLRANVSWPKIHAIELAFFPLTMNIGINFLIRTKLKA